MALELDPETIKYLERLVKRGGHEGEKARSVLEIVKYDEDQARDDGGRFAGGGSGGNSEAHSSDRWSAMDYHSHEATQHGIALLGAKTSEERQAHKDAGEAHTNAHEVARDKGVDSQEYKDAAQKADAADRAAPTNKVFKYSEDQERGENGRWVAGDGSKADKESAKAEVSKQTAAAMRADAAGKHSIAAKAHEAAARAAGHLAQHSSGSKGQQKWNSIANAHVGAAESHRALRSATRENTFGNVDSLKEKASSASTHAYTLTNQAGK
jgi:hypothetical protein